MGEGIFVWFLGGLYENGVAFAYAESEVHARELILATSTEEYRDELADLIRNPPDVAVTNDWYGDFIPPIN